MNCKFKEEEHCAIFDCNDKANESAVPAEIKIYSSSRNSILYTQIYTMHMQVRLSTWAQKYILILI